jgi:cell division protein FtsI (penicillin-binding protein 3)
MKIKLRIIIAFIILLALYGALSVRLFHIQISQHKKFQKMARGNYTVRKNKVSPTRGEICDRNGVALAINKHTYSIGFNFRNKKMDWKMKKDLSGVLGVAKKKLGKYKTFVWLARHVEPADAKELFKHKKNGLVIVKENFRFYPRSPLASQVIGCVGTDNQGLAGIEYVFDDQLRDIGRDQEVMRDAKGRTVYLSTGDEKSDCIKKVYLTLDMNLQYIVERELKNGFRKFSPNWALAVVQDPSNGEILAMAQYPGFDNNDGVPQKVEEMKNKAISTIFEPGSTFKIVTAGAALQEKLVRRNERINCEGGEYEVGGFPIRDFEPHKFLSFEDCMVHSSNIAMAKIGDRLERKLLFKYARDFGFGNFSGIRLPGETRGILRKPDRWSGTSLSRISFGQEIGSNAVQLVGAFSVVANGGTLYEPKIIKKIETKSSSKEYAPLMIRRVISEKTATELKDILKEVVKRGSGVKAQLPGYPVAGKTGTAQKYNPKTFRYYENKYVALFGGFVPADDPKLTILVVYDEPAVSYHWGGYVAAPVFKEIAKAALNYLNIPPVVGMN